MGESKHLKNFRERHLQEGEEIQASAVGFVGEMLKNKAGALIVTNRRVAFYGKYLLGEHIETINRDKVSGVSASSMLGMRTVKVVGSGASVEFKTGDAVGAEAIRSALA
jgi:hypothetical protein